MISPAFLDSQVAIELPAREMLANWNINIAVPIIIQNNINIQVCGVGYANSATCTANLWNVGGIWINY